MMYAGEWHLSFGNAAAGVLADGALFYLVALALLTYLGLGVSALSLPERLRATGWMLAPHLGYSILLVITAYLVAFGADVGTSLLVTLLLCTALNIWALSRGRIRESLGHPRLWLLLPTLSLPHYMITAITMAHNGSLAYVGGQGDIAVLVPLAEWLKTHPARLFSPGFPPLDPFWGAQIAPFGEWWDRSNHLSYTDNWGHEALFLFLRGPLYFQASMGLVLGWDSFLTFRPTQAFMLSLALPATFLFCRHALRAGLGASLLASTLVGLNGTLFFWVSFGHPGQAAWAFLVPTAMLLTVNTLGSGEGRTLLPLATLFAASAISYYQAAPLLVALLIPTMAYELRRSFRRRAQVGQLGVLGLLVLLLALPEHVKMALVGLGGNLIQTGGWGDREFAPLGDALGTTLIHRAFQMVAGSGQMGEDGLLVLRLASAGGTAIGAMLGILGIARCRAAGVMTLRVSLLSLLALLLYLRISDYPYGYSKAQTMVTFLFAAAVALGAAELWHTVRRCGSESRDPGATRRAYGLVATVLAVAVLLSVNSLHMGLSAYAFWKPVGNIWGSHVWEAKSLALLLPRQATVHVSPNILADPESLHMALYFLRDQKVRGTLAANPPLAGIKLLTRQPKADDETSANIQLLGTSEIAAMRGLLPTDLIWSGSLLKAFREPLDLPEPAIKAGSGQDPNLAPPVRLPAVLEVGFADEKGAAGATRAHMLLVLAAESPATVEITTGGMRRSFQVGTGVAVRSFEVQVPERVSLRYDGDSPPLLLSVHVRGSVVEPSVHEDYPQALAVTGHSKRERELILTRFSYLNVGFPTSHSLDVHDSATGAKPGWFELPTYPDSRIREVRFELNPLTLQSRAFLNGTEVPQRSSTRPLADGEYVAYFSLWSEGRVVKRIPLFRYRLEGERLIAFEPFPLATAWEPGSQGNRPGAAAEGAPGAPDHRSGDTAQGERGW